MNRLGLRRGGTRLCAEQVNPAAERTGFSPTRGPVIERTYLYSFGAVIMEVKTGLSSVRAGVGWGGGLKALLAAVSGHGLLCCHGALEVKAKVGYAM